MHEGAHPHPLPEAEVKPEKPRHDGPDGDRGCGDCRGRVSARPAGRRRTPAILTEDLREWALPAVLFLTVLLSWHGGLNRLVGFDVALLGAVLGAAVIIKDTAVVTWRKRRITSGVLVSVALAATVVVEDYRAGTIVALMMLIGEALENRTLRRTHKAIEGLLRLSPETALLKTPGGYLEVPVDEVKVGDVVLVRPGARVPVDGKVVSGAASLDQASITGESMPVDKTEGDAVFAGTVSVSGAVEVKAERVGEATSLAQIVRIVREAQENKGEGQKVADRFAAWFTPAVLVIAAGVWMLTGDVIRSVSILVVACPCALVLATPTAVVASIGSAARQGVLVKGGLTIEEAARVTAVILDKTGTLTLGRPRVEKVFALDGVTESEVLVAAAVAEWRSEHPVARAVVDHAARQGLHVPPPTSFEQLPGVGVRATQGGRSIVVGNRRALCLADASDPGRVAAVRRWLEDREEEGYTSLVVLRGGRPVGCLAVGDTVRAEAPGFVRELKRVGLQVMMVTGDNARTARAVASRLGVDDLRAEVLPADKAAVVSELRAEGHRVVMVGDGVNDAPALATADVGIAMGVAGTDVAIEAADIALMADDLAAVPGVLRLSRAAYRIIWQNILVFALLLNIVGMVLAGQGQLTPVASAVVHNVASVLVVVNSARLIDFKLT